MGPFELFTLLWLGSTVWVFFDAPAHGESRTWALGFLALWIVAFPWYLAVRGRADRPSHAVQARDPVAMELDRLAQLHGQGRLTLEQYEAQRAKVLGRP